MGRKDNSKSKEKKQERKAMEMKMNAGVATIKKANAQTNPLEPLPSFQVFQKNGVNLKIEARRVTELDTETRDWIMDLLERNMKELYIQSEWGYNPETKRSELMEDAAWYLLARDADTNKPVAFSHFRCIFFNALSIVYFISKHNTKFHIILLFRFDMDYDDDVLYCYEIQLEECVRRKGLGNNNCLKST